MRKLAALVVMLLAVVAAGADEAKKEAPKILNPAMLDVDTVGQIEGTLTIKKIINEEDMIVSTDKQPTKPFILRKPTKNQAEGKEFKDAGSWQVKKVISFEGRKYYLLVPASSAKE